MSFTVRFTLVFAAGLAAAALLSPLAALATAALGLRFPFARIFDRTVMATVLLSLLWNARKLRLGERLRAGFAAPARNIGRVLRGFAVAMVAMGILVALAIVLGGHLAWASVVARLPKYLLSAAVIAIIEEGFFRAFLLGGMTEDLGPGGALVVSSAIYALAHLARAPKHSYLGGLHPMAGVQNLAASLSQLAHPAAAFPTLLGLFLLGVVLAGAFMVSGTVYFSVGLHAGLVVGAKSWRKIVGERVALPRWLAGYSRTPLISGVAAWTVSIVILVLLRPLAGPSRNRHETAKMRA